MAKKREFDLDAYPFTVRRMTEDEAGVQGAGDQSRGYLVEYPGVPWCVADDKTAEEAIRHGREALDSCLRTIAESGHQVPVPESRASSGQWRQRVPKSLHARLVDRAEREGVSLNTLVTVLIAEGMGKREVKQGKRG